MWKPNPRTKNPRPPTKDEFTPEVASISRIVPIRENREKKRELLRKAQEDGKEYQNSDHGTETDSNARGPNGGIEEGSPGL